MDYLNIIEKKISNKLRKMQWHRNQIESGGGGARLTRNLNEQKKGIMVISIFEKKSAERGRG